MLDIGLISDQSQTAQRSLERQRHQQAIAEFDDDDLVLCASNRSRFFDGHTPEAVAPVDNPVADGKARQPLLRRSRLHTRPATPPHLRWPSTTRQPVLEQSEHASW